MSFVNRQEKIPEMIAELIAILQSQGLTPAMQPWQAPTLLNSWVNYGSPQNPSGYAIDTAGIVHLRGMVKNGTIGATIFTLPSGYRPENKELQVSISFGPTIARIDIDTNGDVVCTNGNNAWVSLNGITFRAYQ